VVNWIKNVIPQPVMLPAGYVEAQSKAQSKRSSLDKGTVRVEMFEAGYLDIR
jgi:hypothetical protein